VTAAAQNLTRSAVADLLNLRGSKHPSRGNASYKSDDNADHGWFSMGLGIMRQMAHAIQRHALRVLCSAVEKQGKAGWQPPAAVACLFDPETFSPHCLAHPGLNLIPDGTS
jgi:hypothetical protein